MFCILSLSIADQEEGKSCLVFFIQWFHRISLRSLYYSHVHIRSAQAVSSIVTESSTCLEYMINRTYRTSLDELKFGRPSQRH
jgi:hypothetical protein